MKARSIRRKKDSKFTRQKLKRDMTGTEKHYRIEYEGLEVFVTPEQYEDGSWRKIFIEEHGIVLPVEPEPNDIPEYFCPDLQLIKNEITIR